MKLPDAPFVYLVMIRRRGWQEIDSGSENRALLLDKQKLLLGEAIVALNQEESPQWKRGNRVEWTPDPNTAYLRKVQLQAAFGKVTHWAYCVGTNEEFSEADMLQYIQGLPEEDRKQYLLE